MSTTRKLVTVVVAVLASTLLLTSGAAKSATSTPTVTIEKACGVVPTFPPGTNVARVTLTGFPPFTTVQGTLQLPGGTGIGPVQVTTDASGSWDQAQFGFIGTPVPGTWTVTIVWSGGTLTQSVYVDCSQPSTNAECKDDGWRRFDFKNQGQCVAFVERGPKP
jgi:hypothetical protein